MDDFEAKKNKYILSIWKKVNSKNHLQSPLKPDVAVIVCLLKTMGFQLESFERQDEDPNSDEVLPNNIELSMKCGSSKMQAVLKMSDVKCQCPDPDEENESFWSVIGSGNVNKVEETGSTLLPRLSKHENVILQQIIQSLCEIIQDRSNEDDQKNSSICAGNESDFRTLFRSSTQPAIQLTGRSSLPANYKPLQLLSSNEFRSISRGSSNMSSSSESSQRKTPVFEDTFNIDESLEEPRSPPENLKFPDSGVSGLFSSTENVSSQSSNNDMLIYVLNRIRDLEQVVENYIKNPASASQLTQNGSFKKDEIFHKSSSVFGDDLTSQGSISRESSTVSIQSFSRSSTTLIKSDIQRSIVPPLKPPRTDKSSVSSKVTVQPRRSLNLTPKVNVGRTTNTPVSQPAEKKKYLTASERTISQPQKRHASDTGVGMSQRTSLTGRTPLSKTPTSRVSIGAMSKINSKK